jgi:hypothetical protein
LAVTVKAAVLLLDALTVIQPALLVAVQAQPVAVVTLTVPLPPLASKD